MKRLELVIEPISTVLNPVVVEAEITWKLESSNLLPNEFEKLRTLKKNTLAMIPKIISNEVSERTILLCRDKFRGRSPLALFF